MCVIQNFSLLLPSAVCHLPLVSFSASTLWFCFAGFKGKIRIMNAVPDSRGLFTLTIKLYLMALMDFQNTTIYKLKKIKFKK